MLQHYYKILCLAAAIVCSVELSAMSYLEQLRDLFCCCLCKPKEPILISKDAQASQSTVVATLDRADNNHVFCRSAESKERIAKSLVVVDRQLMHTVLDNHYDPALIPYYAALEASVDELSADGLTPLFALAKKIESFYSIEAAGRQRFSDRLLMKAAHLVQCGARIDVLCKQQVVFKDPSGASFISERPAITLEKYLRDELERLKGQPAAAKIALYEAFYTSVRGAVLEIAAEDFAYMRTVHASFSSIIDGPTKHILEYHCSNLSPLTPGMYGVKDNPVLRINRPHEAIAENEMKTKKDRTGRLKNGYQRLLECADSLPKPAE